MNVQLLTGKISSDILCPLAGADGNQRDVKSIITAEDIFASQNFSGGELVLSSGMLLGHSGMLIDCISAMNGAGCAGLCLKLPADQAWITEDVLRHADALRFPLFGISPAFSLAEIFKMLYRRAEQSDHPDFEYVLSAIRELSELTVSGGGLDDIVAMIARKVSNTVMFLTPQLVISSVQTVLRELRKSDLYPSKGQRFFTPAEQMRLEKGFSEQSAQAYQDRLIRNGEPISFMLSPARWGDSLTGYLCILSTNKPFSLLEFWVAENFLPVLAQSMRSKVHAEAAALNMDDLFMWQVLLQQNPDTQRAKQFCALCNFDYDATRICMVMEYPSLAAMPAIQRRSAMEKQRIYMSRRLAEHSDLEKLILIHENMLTILRLVPESIPRIAVILEHELLGDQIVQDISTQFGLDCFIGLSETCRGLETLSSCYFEAAESIALGKKIRPSQSCFSYHEQYLFHRLWHNFTTDELHAICVNILEPIMGDTPDFAELRRTLEAYISCTGNLSQTAERLYIHRNTLNYRMSKLKSLLAVTEISADDFTRYMVGLTILKMI